MSSKKLTIITAEPLGAYHLAPMYDEMRVRKSIFTHLVPYPEKLQGEPWQNISSTLSSVKSSDKVILAGGGFSAWSEAVLAFANKLALPIYISELAYGSFTKKPADIEINKVSVLSPVNMKIICDTLSISQKRVYVTGSPQVLLSRKQKGGVVLLLSTSDMIARDRSANLIKVAEYLQRNNITYLVRTHPREDRSIWYGHPLSNTPLLIDDLSNSEFVVAYSGTPSLNVVASGVPLINLEPNDSFTNAIPRIYKSILPNSARNFEEVITLLHNYTIPNKVVIETLLGNNENAAKNIVDFWES